MESRTEEKPKGRPTPPPKPKDLGQTQSYQEELLASDVQTDTPVEPQEEEPSAPNQPEHYHVRLNPLDPFEAVRYNSKRAPNSRTFFTSLWQKIVDTFYVFNGDTFIRETYIDKNIDMNDVDDIDIENTELQKTKKRFALFHFNTRAGLVDYATLGIFRLIHMLQTPFQMVMNINTSKASNWKKAWAYPLKALLFIPYAILTLAHVLTNGLIRQGLSGLLTFAFTATLIVPLAHVISNAIGALQGRNVAKKIDVSLVNDTQSTVKLINALGGISLFNVDISYNNKDAPDQIHFNRLVEEVEIKDDKKAKKVHPSLVAVGTYSKDSHQVTELFKANEKFRAKVEGPEACEPRRSSPRSSR